MFLSLSVTAAILIIFHFPASGDTENVVRRRLKLDAWKLSRPASIRAQSLQEIFNTDIEAAS
jgi:hypothetical protein